MCKIAITDKNILNATAQQQQKKFAYLMNTGKIYLNIYKCQRL